MRAKWIRGRGGVPTRGAKMPTGADRREFWPRRAQLALSKNADGRRAFWRARRARRAGRAARPLSAFFSARGGVGEPSARPKFAPDRRWSAFFGARRELGARQPRLPAKAASGSARAARRLSAFFAARCELGARGWRAIFAPLGARRSFWRSGRAWPAARGAARGRAPIRFRRAPRSRGPWGSGRAPRRSALAAIFGARRGLCARAAPLGACRHFFRARVGLGAAKRRADRRLSAFSRPISECRRGCESVWPAFSRPGRGRGPEQRFSPGRGATLRAGRREKPCETCRAGGFATPLGRKRPSCWRSGARRFAMSFGARRSASQRVAAPKRR